jgi:hypothetical protein
MSTASTRPFFRCKVVMTPGPKGSVLLHVHRRDGVAEVIPAPSGVTLGTPDLVATQAAGSDKIVIHIGHELVS